MPTLFKTLTALSLLLNCFTVHPTRLNESDIPERGSYEVVFSMQWVDENGEPITDNRSTFYGECGSAKLNASGSLVNVVIHPNGNWITWDFTGCVEDTVGTDHHFYLYSFGQYYLSESYNLTTHGSRTLTLTGMARDISGIGCAVIPGASIYHSW